MHKSRTSKHAVFVSKIYGPPFHSDSANDKFKILVKSQPTLIIILRMKKEVDPSVESS